MDSMELTPPAFPRTVLRACASCARGKAKCVAGFEPDGKCQRCHRLQKRCEPATIFARNQPRKRSQPSTKRVPKDQVQKLEEKLDGLVTLLKATQNPRPNPELLTTATSRINNPAEQLDATSSLRAPDLQRDTFSFCQGATPNVPRSHTDGPAQSDFRILNSFNDIQQQAGFCETIERSLVVTGAASILLQRFRDEMSSYFPFIVLSPSVTADQICQERPFLFLCIMAISCHDTAQQLQLGKQIMRQLAERMLVNCERSLDLLLGVLTYAGCNHLFLNVPQLTSLVASALTLLSDLGLGKTVPNMPPNRSVFEDAIRESSVARYLAMSSTVRSLEEKRAFLGCFYLSSTTAVFFRKTAIIRYSPYVEECLQALDENGEHSNDKLAAALVRLQVISEKINESPWHDRATFSGISPTTVFILSSFQEQLKQFREDLPSEVRDNAIILMHYHAAEIALYEVGLSKQQPQITSSGPQFQRLETLYACLQATKSLWDRFFSIPVRNLFNLSMSTCSDFTSALIVLQLLCNFDHPEWNLDHVRQTIDFNTLLNRLIAAFETVQTEPGCENIDLFTQTARKLAYIRGFLAAKSTDQTRDQGPELQDNQPPQITNAGEYMDILDEAWLKDIFGPWDFQSSLGMA